MIPLVRNQSGFYCGEVKGRSVRLPSVTTVLGHFLMDFSGINPEVLENARQFGTAVHGMVDLFEKGILDMEALDPALKPCLDAWIDCKAHYGFTVLQTEFQVASLRYMYAGTADMLIAGDVLADIKTRPVNFKTDGPQVAAYAEAGREIGLFPKIKKRIMIEINVAGKFKVTELKNKSDFNIFLCALTLFNWGGFKNGGHND
jgi:hypothetical protein